MGNDQSRANEVWWEKALIRGTPMAAACVAPWMRRIMRGMPTSPRCGFCYAPFAGVGGRVLRMAGFAPSRKNPRWCNRCFEQAPLGGVETEVAVLFADVRGYTSLSETTPAQQVTALLNRFYAEAAAVLSDQDAVIDKMVGDQVMALFVPVLTKGSHTAQCVEAAELLLRAIGYGTEAGSWLPVGIGIDVGVAFVGNVGSGDVKDFTAIGDVVNIASRLQGAAKAGQIVLSERTYAHVSDRFPSALPVELELKGKEQRVTARVVDLSPGAV
jgi:adenylate cyclase